MDAKDIELVAQITKEQQQWKETIKKTESQLMMMLIAMGKTLSIVDSWWLDTAKQHLLVGLSAATSAASVALNEKNINAVKQSLQAREAAAASAAAETQAVCNPPVDPQSPVEAELNPLASVNPVESTAEVSPDETKSIS